MQNVDATIIAAVTPADLDAVKELFREYVFHIERTYGVSVAYQDFAGELATFPDRFEALWLARVREAPAGCVALKRLSSTECELKRLYIRDAFRGLGLGRALCDALIAQAQARGYRTLRLDTHAAMAPALALYGALGFSPSDAHNEPGNPDTLFFARAL